MRAKVCTKLSYLLGVFTLVCAPSARAGRKLFFSLGRRSRKCDAAQQGRIFLLNELRNHYGAIAKVPEVERAIELDKLWKKFKHDRTTIKSQDEQKCVVPDVMSEMVPELKGINLNPSSV